ncbi:sensor histidine kinase [Amycolatopsis sp. CA-230715]|uniref:sensor histidine kinase n=1 Tax=Amycolatopsis sp. CA-230715 TaxID=2745196 RepID=UPI001C012E5A|nr:histidine kinase [Amycolatopsis sp. CA-230715]QWF81199.1 Sensor histidine kinase DesK [Amycolatopsis sp. CA-230715]
MPPRVPDVLVAVLAAALAIPVTVAGQDAPGVLAPGTGVTGAGWLLFVAVHLPLLWRSRAPTAVFWCVLALVGVCAALGVTGVFLVFSPLFALFAVARHSEWHWVWPVVGAVVLVVATAALGTRPGWPGMIGVVSVLAVTVLLGIALRWRRAFAAERAASQARDAQAAVAEERARIAREVHDIVAHNLAVMVALADGASCTAGIDPGRAADLMAKTATTGRRALAEMRRLVTLLREGDRAPEPGVDDIDDLVARVRAAGLRVVVSRAGAAGPWGPGVGLAVHRIVQEALTNTMKHAGPLASARVRLRYSPEGAEVEITDDGTGNASPEPGGHGLIGITERVKAYGGQVEAGAFGSGWRVRAFIPAESDVDGETG